MPCARCGDLGTVEESCPTQCTRGTLRCVRCQGTGMVYKHVPVAGGLDKIIEVGCPDCRRRGWVTCPACRGRPRKIACPDCRPKKDAPRAGTNEAFPSNPDVQPAPTQKSESSQTLISAPAAPNRSGGLVGGLSQQQLKVFGGAFAASILICYLSFLSCRGFRPDQMGPHVVRILGIDAMGSEVVVEAPADQLDADVKAADEALGYIYRYDSSDYDLVNRRIPKIVFAQNVSDGYLWFSASGHVLAHTWWCSPDNTQLLAAHLVFAAHVVDGDSVVDAERYVRRTYIDRMSTAQSQHLLPSILTRNFKGTIEYGIEPQPRY